MNLYCKSLGVKVSTNFLVNSPLKKRRKMESRCVPQLFPGGIVTGDAPPIRDLTIRQRRWPGKYRWKIDFASFHFFSRLFQGAQLLKRREFGLDLKKRHRARVQTQMVEFIPLPFPFPNILKIWSFHGVVVQGLQRNVQKSVMHVQSCCFAH